MVKALTKNLKGEIYPEFSSLLHSTCNQVDKFVQEYVKECFDSNIDPCAAEGYLLMLISTKLAFYRSKLLYEEYNRTGNNLDDLTIKGRFYW